jgi:hypothetical protein
MWWGDVAPDQRPTDAFSLVYDSAPLEQDTEILGLPLARLQVSADAPQANWIARLSDVAPDGTVTLVTGAARNGSHRDSAREPAAIQPGQWFPLDIEMHFTSWVFPKGHRIRRLPCCRCRSCPPPPTRRVRPSPNRRPIRNCPAMRTSASAALPATARFRR